MSNETCFYCGISLANNALILDFLCKFHHIDISLRTLKTKLKNLELRRRNIVTANLIQDTENALRGELAGPSRNSGYRSMWKRLSLYHGVFAPRDIVMAALKKLDPEGTENRSHRKLKRRQYRSPGPNACWHLDGYDKLKPFGFPIHGCIDGYSRKIMWLKVIHSNNDPYVIASLFIESISELNGYPQRVRSDCGTENVAVAAIQSYLRRLHNDEYSGLKAHIYGTSHNNQRIEAWWSYYRRNRSSELINLFKDFVEDVIFNPANELHIASARFCFGELIQKDLDSVVECWNSHVIRPSSTETVSGIPDELYYFPEHTDAENRKLNANGRDLQEVRDYVESGTVINNDEICFEYCIYSSAALNISGPLNWDKAIEMFLHILTHS